MKISKILYYSVPSLVVVIIANLFFKMKLLTVFEIVAAVVILYFVFRVLFGKPSE